MTEQQVGFGIIGLGTWGENHLKTFADEPGVYTAGICDLNEELLKQRAEEYDVGFATTDYEELLARDDIQAVSVVTPDFLHYDIAVAAGTYCWRSPWPPAWKRRARSPQPSARPASP